jgi:uncharacterized membrane protein YagU involved in acid resistance
MPSALVAGTIASFAMNAVQATIAAVFERERPANDRDEEVEAISALVKEIARLLSRKPDLAIDGRLLHYLFGGAFAVAYCDVRKHAPVIASGRGAAFGIVLWIVSDLVLIRAIGLVRNDRRYSIPERANAFASHLAYGMVLEAVVRALETP